MSTRFISVGYGIGALGIFISCLLFSCKSKSVIKLKPGKVKGTRIEGKFIDDSFMDGEIKHFKNHEISVRKFNQEVFSDTIFYPKTQNQKYYMKITTNESPTGREKIYYRELIYGRHS